MIFGMRAYKIYVCIALLIIILLLGAILGSIVYAGKKVSTESAAVTNKVNTFNQNVNNINKNLQGINSRLQTENTDLETETTNLPQHATLP